MTAETKPIPYNYLHAALRRASPSLYLGFSVRNRDDDELTDAEQQLANLILKTLFDRKCAYEDGLFAGTKAKKRGEMPDLLDRPQGWEDFVDIDSVKLIARKTGGTPASVLEFMIKRCNPRNWRSLFWMSSWFDAVAEGNSSEQMARMVLEVESRMAAAAKEQKTLRGKEMANALHDKAGGSRDRKHQIREMWALGNFTTRERCAEESYSSVGFKTLGTAKKALQNTPDPSPWPAKQRP